MLIVLIHLSFIFFEPAHSPLYDHTDKNRWEGNVLSVHTRVDRVFELLFIFVYIADLWLQYKAIGWDSFKADYLYMNSLSCIPQIHVCFVVPFLLLNTLICVVYPPFPQYSRCLRSFLAFRKLLNVNKIAVAITSASRGLVEILLLLLMHLFMFAMYACTHSHFLILSNVFNTKKD